MVVALSRVRTPSPRPTNARSGAGSADAGGARSTPGRMIGTPACRPLRRARDTRKEPVETAVPTAVHTPAVTTALANTTEPRAGTAAVVVPMAAAVFAGDGDGADVAGDEHQRHVASRRSNLDRVLAALVRTRLADAHRHRAWFRPHRRPGRRAHHRTGPSTVRLHHDQEQSLDADLPYRGHQTGVTRLPGGRTRQRPLRMPLAARHSWLWTTILLDPTLVGTRQRTLGRIRGAGSRAGAMEAHWATRARRSGIRRTRSPPPRPSCRAGRDACPSAR